MNGLLPGEQMASSQSMPALSIKQAVAWSQNALAQLAILQRQAAPRSVQAEVESLDELSVEFERGNAAARQEREQARLRSVFVTACGACHSPDLVGNSHFETQDEYVAMINRMIPYGAQVQPQEVGSLAAYLMATYGKKSEDGANDPGKSVLNMSCVSCHAADVLKNQPLPDKEAYKALVERMVNYGADVPKDDMDALLEYLLKTYSNNGKKTDSALPRYR